MAIKCSKVKRDNSGRKKTMILPSELITEILLRLPLKPLVRFKCVCKSWLSLISNPHFATSHFERAATARKKKLVFLSHSNFLSIDLNASLHDDFASAPLNLNFLSGCPCYCHVSSLGSCRGFVLLCSHLSLYVWNPFTGVHKQIPLSPFKYNDIDMYGDLLFSKFIGFGYDSSTDDYLVVQATFSAYGRLRAHATSLKFFSLRANAWKQIEIEASATHLSYRICSDYFDNQMGWLLNGAIHWLAFSYDLSMNVILTFDLSKRSFSEIPLPADFEYCNFRFCVLRVLGEFLNLCAVGQIDDHSTEIWVMKEYKVQSSWTKTIVVSVYDVPIENFIPICSVKCGDVVGTDCMSGLVKCNDKGQLQEHRIYFNDPCEFPSMEVVYTESLFSLPSGHEQAEEDDD